MVGYSIGRIGCFLVGDDYGLPSSLPWAISFPDGIPPTTISSFSVHYPWIDISNIDSEIIKVHPTQVYESIAGLLCFYYLWKQRVKNKNSRESIFYLFNSSWNRKVFSRVY